MRLEGACVVGHGDAMNPARAVEGAVTNRIVATVGAF